MSLLCLSFKFTFFFFFKASKRAQYPHTTAMSGDKIEICNDSLKILGCFNIVLPFGLLYQVDTISHFSLIPTFFLSHYLFAA